ncbi:MAG: PP2C family protein-serine/threonine phosphatase [Planctomycetota bacterium]
MPMAGEQQAVVRNMTEAPQLVCAEIWGGNHAIDAPIRLPGIRGQVFSLPAAGGRGGDIHYVSICSSGLLSRFCLADVAGHGEPVAQVSQEIHRLLRQFMNHHDERRVLAGLNQRLQGTELERMTTAAAVSYLPPLRMLTVSYAGHPPAWFYSRAQGRWSRLRAETRRKGPIDLPLAVLREAAYSRRKLRVRPGDQLVLVTDGVLEAPSSDGVLYGDDRLDRLLDERAGEPIEGLVAAIIASLRAYTGDPQLGHDDVTVLAVEFQKGPPALGLGTLLRNRLFGWRRRRET